MLLSPSKNEPICKMFLEQNKCIFNPVYVVNRESSERYTKVVLFEKTNQIADRRAVLNRIVGVWLTYRWGKLHWRVHNLHSFILAAARLRGKRQSGRVLFSISSGLTYQPPYCKHFISSSCQKRLCVDCCLGFNLKGKPSRRARLLSVCLLPPPMLTVLS